jgi:hypothetical protein
MTEAEIAMTTETAAAVAAVTAVEETTGEEEEIETEDAPVDPESQSVER